MEEATLESGVPSPTETGLKKAKTLVDDGVQFPAQLLDALALLWLYISFFEMSINILSKYGKFSVIPLYFAL